MADLKETEIIDRFYYELLRIRKEIDALLVAVDANRDEGDRNRAVADMPKIRPKVLAMLKNRK